MTATNWIINSNQSDVIIKAKRTVNTYLVSNKSDFNGSIAIKDDTLEDASVEFMLDLNANTDFFNAYNHLPGWNTGAKIKQPLAIRFKSTSFQKINSNINFLKGYLTINNITKIVELEAVLAGLETSSGVTKAVFEIFGDINRQDFEIADESHYNLGVLNIGRKLNLMANIEFTNSSNIN